MTFLYILNINLLQVFLNEYVNEWSEIKHACFVLQTELQLFALLLTALLGHFCSQILNLNVF